MNNVPFTAMLGSILTVVGVALYVYALFDIQARDQRIQIYESEITTKELERKKLDAITNLAEQTEEDRAQIQKYAVPAEGVAELLEIVEGLGASTKADVEIVSVAVKPRVVDERNVFEEVDLAITVQGSFQNVYQTVSLLETLPYPVAITQTRFEVRKDGKARVWSASVMMSVLKLK